MNRKLILLLLAAIFSIQFVNAQPGTWRQIGQKGFLGNTICAASYNGILYSVEASGFLYKTNPSSGVYTALDKGNYINSIFMTAGNNYLISIEKDGSLYRTDLIAMKWQRMGEVGAWANTIAAALNVNSGKLYTVESSGVLYVTDIATGVWTEIGKPEFNHTKFLFAANSNLYSIEEDGSLYIISTIDGSWKQLGEAGAWANTLGGANLGDKLYTVESDGTLYETTLSTGIWRQLGKPEFQNTRFLLPGLNKIYTIEADGTLYEVNIY